MIRLNELLDVGATPRYFGFFEDFLGGFVTDNTGGTPASTIADLTATYSQSLTEAAVAALAAITNVGTRFVFDPVGGGSVGQVAANGGWLRISGAATTDNSGGQIQARAAFVCTNNKRIAFMARAQLTEATSTNGATESDLFLGLFPVDTSIEASLPTDGIYFVKADGGTSLIARSRVASTNVSTTITSAWDKSVHTYGILVEPVGTTLETDGTSTIRFYYDGVEVATHRNTNLPANTVILTPTLAFQSGDNTGTKRFDVDYIGCTQER